MDVEDKVLIKLIEDLNLNVNLKVNDKLNLELKRSRENVWLQDILEIIVRNQHTILFNGLFWNFLSFLSTSFFFFLILGYK